MALDRLFQLMAEKKASDLYIAVGAPISMRLNGKVVSVNPQRLDYDGVKRLLNEVLTDQHWNILNRDHELNIGHGVRGVGSFRISVFRQRGTHAAVVRYVPGEVPSFASLGLPDELTELVSEPRGLVLVVGGTGSGKSTTLAAMIDHRNASRSGHILTIEDPIEFNFKNKLSIVNQREIGTDCETLTAALKSALRQAPDCIMIGEIRDHQTMAAAIAFAQSGHLVVATLHANNAAHALNRIVSLFPLDARDSVRGDLSVTLKAIVGQRLVKTTLGHRTPVVELLVNQGHTAELLAKGAVAEIKEQMERSMAPGSVTFEQALAHLVQDGRISAQEAMQAADSPTNLLWMINNPTHNARPSTKRTVAAPGIDPLEGFVSAANVPESEHWARTWKPDQTPIAPTVRSSQKSAFPDLKL